MKTIGRKIAYLTGEYPRATDTFVWREVEALRRLGFEIRTCSVRMTETVHHVGEEQKAAVAETFYIIRAARNPLRLLRDHGALLARSPKRWLSAFALALRTHAPGMKGLLWQLFYFAEAGVLADRLRREGVGHLHNHFTDSSCTVAMLASALSGVPYSATMHGPSDFFAPEKWRLGEKIARARFVACISHFCRSQGMLFSAPEHWGKLHVIHCGVEPARYGAGEGRGRGDGVQLLFVGRLAAVKGVRVLLEALSRLADRDLRLTLIGDGPERADLEALAARLGLSAQVRFLGYRSQDAVAQALRESDLFVLPSFAEGVPVVLMEAMASRLPVIATRVGGVAELVEHGVSGLLVAPSDVDGLVAAIADLAADPDRRTQMGKAGRAKVEEAFDLARETARLAGLFGAYGGTSDPGRPVRPGLAGAAPVTEPVKAPAVSGRDMAGSGGV